MEILDFFFSSFSPRYTTDRVAFGITHLNQKKSLATFMELDLLVN